MPQLTVRYFAAARAAAGVDSEIIEANTVHEAVSTIGARHGERLATVITACSFLLDGIAVHDRMLPLSTNAKLDVLPPFAGG